jgi:hypothetical protein
MLMRSNPSYANCYMRGLTQQEEDAEGVDIYLQLHSGARVFAFQFKAPMRPSHCGTTQRPTTYRYLIGRTQHALLYGLARHAPGSVFYVLSDYCCLHYLELSLPHLLSNAWLVDIADMQTGAVFGARMTRTMVCTGGTARINPTFKRVPAENLRLRTSNLGADSIAFRRWVGNLNEYGFGARSLRGQRTPIRGLRFVVVPARS